MENTDFLSEEPQDPVQYQDLVDCITYDTKELLAMSVTELLVQQIARQDLFFPKRKRDVDASRYREKIVTEVQRFIDALSKAPLSELQTQLQGIADQYLEGFS